MEEFYIEHDHGAGEHLHLITVADGAGGERAVVSATQCSHGGERHKHFGPSYENARRTSSKHFEWPACLPKAGA